MLSCLSCQIPVSEFPAQRGVVSGLDQRGGEQIWREGKREVMSRDSRREEGLLTLAGNCKELLSLPFQLLVMITNQK